MRFFVTWKDHVRTATNDLQGKLRHKPLTVEDKTGAALSLREKESSQQAGQ